MSCYLGSGLGVVTRGGEQKVTLLQPEDWPSAHEDGGVYVWSPPLAAANPALDWLGQSIHKRPYNTHVLLIPRLMTLWGQRKLLKTADVAFNILLDLLCGLRLITNH